MLDQLTAADFESLPERRIVLLRGEQRIVLDVVEVRTLAQHAPRNVAPFSVTLRESSARTSLPQGTFRYEHPLHGALDLFTVPVGPDGQGMCYEIIFN
jgi:hypothetical protein